jgi:hypothetical protein
VTPISPTEPEPWRDIEAQFAALLDPLHPKRAVWVSRGTLYRPPPDIPCLALDAGTFYANPERLAELRAEPSEEVLARLLDYVECKSALKGEVPVVQARSEGGWVVHEMASSWGKIGLARARAAPYGEVRVLSLAAVRARRMRLIAEEKGCQKEARSPTSSGS